MSMVFCRGCGKEIHETAPTCPHCGATQNAGTAEKDIPDGVRGWSWGAFLLNWIWAIGNKTWIGLLALVPYVGFIMAIILGVKGREWAWKNKEWASVEEFNRVQRKWSAWGVGLTLGLLGVGILVAIAISVYLGNTQRAEEALALQERVERAARQAEAQARLEEQMRQQQAEVGRQDAEQAAQVQREAESAAQQGAQPASQLADQGGVTATPQQAMQFAPSFDCLRAATGAERLICSNRELAVADVQMAQVYRDVIARSADREALRRDQTTWRRNVRDACADVGCMLSAYSQRMQALVAGQ